MNNKELAVITGYEESKLDLIKTTIAKGCTDDELQLFLYVAKTTGLDPLTKQIYAIKRWDGKAQKEVMAIQTGIDGLRSIADRTGEYAPGKANTYEYDKDGGVISATAYVMKLVGGTWHEVSVTAHWGEYAQYYKNKSTNKFELSKFWDEKPHIMLGKCAEALALRKAFPGQTANLYTAEEMPHVVATEAVVEGEIITGKKEPEEPQKALPEPAQKGPAKEEASEKEPLSIMDWTLIDKLETVKAKGKMGLKITFGDIILYNKDEAMMAKLAEVLQKKEKIKVMFDSKTKLLVEIKREAK